MTVHQCETPEKQLQAALSARGPVQFLRRWWAPLTALSCALCCIAFTAHYWCWLTEPNQEIRSQVIRNTGLVAAAVVAFVLTTWRSILAQRQSEIAQLNYLEGRFQNASDMLSSKVLLARLGGIHTLDQLARDYPKEFHIPVARLFAAFVRRPPGDIDNAGRKGADGIPLPREDVQTIMVSLGGRTAGGTGARASRQCCRRFTRGGP